jgi:hypothetical protein
MAQRDLSTNGLRASSDNSVIQRCVPFSFNLLLHLTYNENVINQCITGSAIYVYFILANGHTDDLTQRFPHTLLSFRLDKVPVGPDFRHEPQKNKGFEYNAPVYVNTTLSAGPHDLDIIADGPTEIIILFDYAVYTCAFVGVSFLLHG